MGNEMKPGVASPRMRQAVEEDLVAVLATERANLRPRIDDPGAEARWLREVGEPHLRGCLEGGRLWVCEDDEGIIGHYYYSPTREPGVLSLDSIQVAPPRQRRGFSTIMLDHFMKMWRERGDAMKLVLLIDARSPAVKLYEVFGFAAVGGRDGRLLMEKQMA